MRWIRRNRATRAGRRRRESLASFAVVGATAIAILLMTAGALWMSAAGGEPDGGRPGGEVLAVMPFESLESDPAVAQFGVGLADSIISRLSGVPGLTVRPMSAALGALAAGSDPLQAGRGLRATAVMVGEYRQTPNGFEVKVRLVDTRTAATLWQGEFRSSVSDLIQAERTILDPDFAPAHAELATASANMFLGGHSSDPAWIARALAAGSRAVYLDDRSAAGHSALGAALLLAGDPVASTRETIRALQLDPGDAYALRALANLIAGAGHPEPVRALRDAARRSDPSIEVGWLDVWLAMIEGDYESKMDELRHDVDSRRAAGLSPELPVMQLGALSFEAGDTANQLHWATMLEKVTANKAYADMLRLLAIGRAGDKSGMRALVEKNRDFYIRTWEYCDLIGRGLAAMGETEASLVWIERSVERGNYDKGTWERSPMLDGLRGNPRFEAALATVRERTGAIVRLAEFAGYM